MTRCCDVCKNGAPRDCGGKVNDYEKLSLIDCQCFTPKEPAYFLAKLAETLTEREAEHGDKHKVFAGIAERWSRDFGAGVSEVDVAYGMIDFKMARLKENPKNYDTWLDIAGYAACGAELARAACKS